MNKQEILDKHAPDGELQRPIVLCCIEACCGVVIAPSAKMPGMIQASYFATDSLFEADIQLSSVDSALTHALQQGYEEDGEELLSEILRASTSVH